MKLYFYFLDNPGSSDAIIRCEECEVIEKEKTYIPVDSFPSGYEYHRYYIKRRIGRIETNLVRTVMVVTDKPNWQRAKQAFMNYCDHERQDAQNKIYKAEEQLDNMWKTTNYVAAWKGGDNGGGIC